MFHKIKQVQPMPDMFLHVTFETGENKSYDVKPLLQKYQLFQPLTKNGIFNKVQVDTGGCGISWNDEIDLSCNELWDNGIDLPN
jgi:hypothetical protein